MTRRLRSNNSHAELRCSWCCAGSASRWQRPSQAATWHGPVAPSSSRPWITRQHLHGPSGVRCFVGRPRAQSMPPRRCAECGRRGAHPVLPTPPDSAQALPTPPPTVSLGAITVSVVGTAPPTFIRPFTLPNGDVQRAPTGCYPPVRHVRAPPFTKTGLRRSALAHANTSSHCAALRDVAATPSPFVSSGSPRCRTTHCPQTFLKPGV